MAKVIGIENDAINCNGGGYGWATITLDDGTTQRTYTCGCGRGCSNTTPLPSVGDSWEDYESYIDELEAEGGMDNE